MTRFGRAAFLALLAPGLAVAQQAEPAWTPYYECIANTDRVADAMTAFVSGAGDGSSDPKIAAVMRAATIDSMRPEIRKYDRAARKAIEAKYDAWAANETEAGRAPPSKKELPKLALAEARARAAQKTAKDFMDIDAQCKAMAGVKD